MAQVEVKSNFYLKERIWNGRGGGRARGVREREC